MYPDLHRPSAPDTRPSQAVWVHKVLYQLDREAGPSQRGWEDLREGALGWNSLCRPLLAPHVVPKTRAPPCHPDSALLPAGPAACPPQPPSGGPLLRKQSCCCLHVHLTPSLAFPPASLSRAQLGSDVLPDKFAFKSEILTKPIILL